MTTCQQCKKQIELWNKQCSACGFHLVLEPDEVRRARFLRAPSLGAMFFTQGWALGARLYFWFLLSLIPIVGFVVLLILLFFGRRLSYKSGSWASWDEYTKRMRILDLISVIWVVCLILIYLYLRASAR